MIYRGIKNSLTNSKVAQNALVVEQEFCTPQDIEGGIKDDDIYFWQTRNIVDKVE